MRPRNKTSLTLGFAAAWMAGAAQAQAAAPEAAPEAAHCAGCAAEGLMLVPVAERLSVGDVFADAAPEVQLVFALLLASTAAALVVWGASFGKVGKADAKGLAGALGRLRIVRSGGIPLGALAASYTLFSGFLGMANVRPTPSLSVLAPGWAEAALAVMLGLLATTVAVLCERHLEGRIRRAAA
jgi:hypothetical protein